MGRETLLGHVAEIFSGQIENIATESLVFIIKRSSSAKAALQRYFEQAGIKLGKIIGIQSQVGDKEGSIPDIQGRNETGETVLIIESKFWAGLTQAQPVNYLKTVTDETESLVAFVAPCLRLPTLWAELLRRCGEAGYEIVSPKEVSPEFMVVRISKNKWLGIVTWRELLTSILRSVESDSQDDIAADVKQLMGLCDKQDEEVFLPLAAEELSVHVGKRIVQLHGLVNKLTERLVAAGHGSVKGLKATGGENWFGRYIRISRYGFLIHFNARYWGQWRETPLWLNIKEIINDQWEVTSSLRLKLESLDRENPSRLFHDATDNDVPCIPLFLPFGVEEKDVLDSLQEQVLQVIGLLNK